MYNYHYLDYQKLMKFPDLICNLFCNFLLGVTYVSTGNKIVPLLDI